MLDFGLTQEQEEIRRLARKFADNELAPKAPYYDKTGEFPWEHFKKMAELGFTGMMLPPEYGGLGADTLTHTVVIEEIARGSAVMAVMLEVHNTLACESINRFGTPELKKKYLPKLASGEYLGAFALTEPNSGSDVSGMRTTAVLQGDSYVLNGSKCFITSGGQAHLYLVMARTNKGAGARGISAFLVEKGTPGLSFGQPEEKMGLTASHTTDLILDNCRIPRGNLVGREGEGFKIALTVLDGGRLGIGAQALGITQAAFEAAIKYSKERVQFGQPIANFQAIQWMLAEMSTDLDAARMLLYHAAWLKDQGVPMTTEAARAKLFASTMAVKHTAKAVQIHGGYGYMKEYNVERFMREAKVTEIYEGTSEIQKLVIARNVLK